METAVECRETSPEADLVSLLMERGLTISTAESCTGGMISARLVNIPGASQVFEQGMVTYSNEAKMRLLGVKEETLKEFGGRQPPDGRRDGRRGSKGGGDGSVSFRYRHRGAWRRKRREARGPCLHGLLPEGTDSHGALAV